MLQTQRYIMKKANRMVAEKKPVIAKHRAMDKMWKNQWSLPEDISEDLWIYPAVDSSPADALHTAVTTFSANTPNPTLTPLGPSPEDKEKANKVERGLMWAFQNADKRAETRLVPDIMRSSLRYDEVAIQIIHLPTHYEAIGASIEKIENEEMKSKKLDANERRKRAALRKGDFVINVWNPQNVFARHSDIGLECVLLAQEMRADDIVAKWEHMAESLLAGGAKTVDTGTGYGEVVRDDNWGEEKWTYYDYQDYDQRLVWVSKDSTSAESNYIILDVENKVPFLSWAISVGGTSLDSAPEDRRVPYLNSVYTSGSWELVCLLDTLAVSETLKYSGTPRVITTTPTGEGVAIDYSGDQPSINLRPGEEVAPWEPPRMDMAVIEMKDRARAQIDGQTRIRVLMNPDFPANTAFATINALLKTSLNGLMPWKELAESACGGMYEVMLLWVSYSERPLIAWGTQKGAEGEHYSIEPLDFNADHIYMDVRLDADVASDKVEQANTGTILYERLGYPLAEVMTQLGEQDPQSLMQDRAMEDMLQNEIALMIEQRRAEMQMKLAQIQMAMQEMQQMQQMQQQGAPPGPPGMGGAGGPTPQQQPPPSGGLNEAMYEALKGDGTNPAQGGMSTAQAVPAGTKEMLTKMDRAGEQTAV